tara:strand:- start:1945 stop:2166 length:222 start_codon:yes stop_codon:yes gene_type:complete
MTIAALIAANTTAPSLPAHTCECYVVECFGDENWDMDTRTLTLDEAQHLVDIGTYAEIVVEYTDKPFVILSAK